MNEFSEEGANRIFEETKSRKYLIDYENYLTEKNL